MLIAIISDIHDNLPNLKTTLDWCHANKIEKIILCGDTTTLETINYLAANFSGEIFMVRGNIELWEDKEIKSYKNIHYYGVRGIAEINGVAIGFCHEPDNINKLLKTAKSQPEIVFYGHTHKPWLEKRGKTIIANPGNIAGVWHQATFAVWDMENKKLELKILANLRRESIIN